MVRSFKILFAFLAALLVFSISTPAWAESSGESSQSAGWTPGQANEWTVAQMKYAQAVKQYGKDSPEATQAQVMMNTMARDLGITPTADVPEEASMDISTAPDTDDEKPAIDQQASQDQPGSPSIDPDHSQPAPQEVQQVPEPVQVPDSVANIAAPTPAPAVTDPPIEK